MWTIYRTKCKVGNKFEIECKKKKIVNLRKKHMRFITLSVKNKTDAEHKLGDVPSFRNQQRQFITLSARYRTKLIRSAK